MRRKRKKNGLYNPVRLRHFKPGQPNRKHPISSANRHPEPERNRFSLIRLANRNLFSQMPACRQPEKTGTVKYQTEPTSDGRYSDTFSESAYLLIKTLLLISDCRARPLQPPSGKNRRNRHKVKPYRPRSGRSLFKDSNMSADRHRCPPNPKTRPRHRQKRFGQATLPMPPL